MDDHLLFIPMQGHYTPTVDEPSPFGPDQLNYKDNPWIIWKRNRPGYDEQQEGSASLVREALIEQLKAEKPRTQMERGQWPPELSTSDGEVSLAAVLWLKDTMGPTMPIEEVHARLAGKLAHWKALDAREIIHERIYGKSL